MGSQLLIEKVTKRYGKKTVLNELSFQAAPGEFIVLVGPSGCGKSTMLRSIAGLESIDSGLVRIGERDVTKLEPKDRNIAMVFQDYALYPHKNVYENIAFGLRTRKLPEKEIHQRVTEAAEKLELTNLLDRKPAALSGGQRQRVAIGRAIVRQPEVFLFDEPLSNLDAKLRGSMRLSIAKLHKELSATVVYVTHDQIEAMTLADRIIVLNGGRIQQMGTPLQLYYHPSNIFVATFIGSPPMNLLEGTIEADTKLGGLNFHSKSDLTFPIPEQHWDLVKTKVKEKQVLVWGFRPENFKLIKPEEVLPAHQRFRVKVLMTEPLGASTTVVADLAGCHVHLSLPEPHRPKVGDVLEMKFASKHLYLFDLQTTESIVEP